MATALETFTFARGSRNGSKYDQWLDGRAWRLEQGVDFQNKPNCLRNTLDQVAKRRGKRIRVQVIREPQSPLVMVVQAYAREE